LPNRTWINCRQVVGDGKTVDMLFVTVGFV